MKWTWTATVLTCVLGDMSETDIYCYAFVLQVNDIDWSEILLTPPQTFGLQLISCQIHFKSIKASA